MVTDRSEDYLEAIEDIIRKKGYARPKDVRESLHLGSSTVTEMLQKLSAKGLIGYEKYGKIVLTPKGKKIARQTQKKHDMLTELLTLLGLDDATAEEDACKIEHVLSKDTSDRLSKFVEFINHPKGKPRWLEHFDFFYKTGGYVECTPQSEAKCPVHGKKHE
jgi:DtxR family transcriptional regulator, Mn-dependent transcriptional regulator